MRGNEHNANVGLAEATTEAAMQRLKNVIAIRRRQAELHRTHPLVAAWLLLLAAGMGYAIGTALAGAVL